MSSFQGINISVALDLSKSMEAADIGENRLEASKSVIIDFINKRPIDKIGLVVFAKQALPKVPATLDHSVLIDKIKEIAIEDIPSNGTDIGKAIAFSVATLKNCEGSKAIVLVTDGSDTSGSNMPITSAEIAKKLGIKIYTIGVGSTTPTDIFGSFFRVGEIDEELLEKISHITNGKYYRASNEKELQNIFNEIDNLEKTNLTDSSYDVEELFLDFLKIAIFLLLFTTIFTETIWTEV
jgi:Ca-activated chloride channel family protein